MNVKYLCKCGRSFANPDAKERHESSCNRRAKFLSARKLAGWDAGKWPRRAA